MGTSLTVKNLLANLDKIAAFGLAEKWDNVGLMLGDPDQEIQGILVALDPTEEVLAEAKECGADCIISHHPLIFTPLKAIYTNQPLGRFLRWALENEISVTQINETLAQGLPQVDGTVGLTKNFNIQLFRFFFSRY